MHPMLKVARTLRAKPPFLISPHTLADITSSTVKAAGADLGGDVRPSVTREHSVTFNTSNMGESHKGMQLVFSAEEVPCGGQTS